MDQYDRVRPSQVETLLVGGELDTSTPPQIATEELLPNLPNGQEVVLPGFGHTASLFDDQPEATARLINTYLATGEVDTSLYRPQRVDFTPGLTATAIVKIITGTMVGLALFAMLSLLWMARRVSRRRVFGPRASATLRSVFPAVLGLGGWFVGVLIVLATTADVALDAALLVAVSMGVPIGLGVYLAWVEVDWTATTKTAGLAAAAAGALVGAWLGLNATGGITSLITAVVGSTAGANLTLLALDIAWERLNRSRFAAAVVPPSATRVTVEPAVPEPRTAVGDTLSAVRSDGDEQGTGRSREG